MDKVICLAYILYQSSTSELVKEKAIQLLNGDVTLIELKKSLQPDFSQAEAKFKRNEFNKNETHAFAEKYMLMEV